MPFLPGVRSAALRGRMYAIAGSSLCVLRDATAARIPLVEDAGDALYLGTLDGEPCFARALTEGDPLPEGTQALPLRQLFGALSDDEFALAGRALGLTAWDRDHRFCGRCAAPTKRDPDERVRRCTACDNASYPRLSPAMIVLVERDGRALLARNARVSLPFFSALAGFVEPGETLEEAVRREVFEEAGVHVGTVRYHSSQPWPFPASLMMGCMAEATSEEIRVDSHELEDARWFTRDQVRAALAGKNKELALPPPLAIAHQLAYAWAVS